MGKVIGIVIIVALLAAGLWFLSSCQGWFGLGNGNSGNGNGESSSIQSENSATEGTTTETTTTITTVSIPAVGVTVNGNDYFYENHSYSLDDLLTELKKLDAGTAVRITDENASLNAYNALTDALDVPVVDVKEVVI